MDTNKIRNSLKSHRAEFNSEDWNQMEALLDKKEGKKRFIWIPLTAIMLISSLAWLGLQTHQTKNDFGGLKEITKPIVNNELSICEELNTITNELLKIKESKPIISDVLHRASSPRTKAKISYIKASSSLNDRALNTLQTNNASTIKTEVPKTGQEINLNAKTKQVFAVETRDFSIVENPEDLYLGKVSLAHLDIKPSTDVASNWSAIFGLSSFQAHEALFKSVLPGLSLSIDYKKARWAANMSISSLNRLGKSSNIDERLLFADAVSASGDRNNNSSLDDNGISSKYVTILSGGLNYELVSKKISLSPGIGGSYIFPTKKLLPFISMNISYDLSPRFSLNLQSKIHQKFMLNSLGLGYRF